MNKLLAECIAEALGTFVIIAFGTGSVAMVKLFGTGTPGEVVNGGFTNITIAWGLAVTMAAWESWAKTCPASKHSSAGSVCTPLAAIASFSTKR